MSVAQTIVIARRATLVALAALAGSTSCWPSSRNRDRVLSATGRKRSSHHADHAWAGKCR